MSKLNKIAAGLGLAVAVCFSAPISMAQDVLVVDTAKVFVSSKAGQDLSAKVQQIGKTMESELTPEKNALATEKQSLDAKLQGKTAEQVRADQALVAQGKAYTRKVETYAMKSEKRGRELVATERTALQIFGQKMRTAVETVRANRGGKIVIDKTNVFVADASADITNDVVTELDKIAPTITVQRVSLPDQPQSSNGQ